MKLLLKKLFKSLAVRISNTPAGLYAYQEIIDSTMTRNKEVTYRGHLMKFAAPNWLTQYRVNTFASKEPETLEWIDSIPQNATLWDIGANVGLYSIYAAKSRGCKVFSFEPSVFNLELLARNIFLNNLHNQIAIIPLALSDRMGSNLFKMSTTAWGGALSTFGESFDQDGNEMKEVFEYQTFGVSMEQAVEVLNVPAPDYIKIDVDGIEHFILRGGATVLRQTKSVLIEINESFVSQAQDTEKFLTDAGLTLYKKCGCDSPNQFNQWWVRQH